MSLLDQAKREAKRLFKLAKNHPATNNTYQLPFTNLSHSREYIANINGYPNWHDYEENLKRKDFIYGVTDKATLHKEQKLTIENKEYFIQDKNFIVYKNIAREESVSYKYQEHIPIIIGDSIVKKGLFKNEQPEKWSLDAYPVIVSGSTGAGKTEILLSVTSQYLDNKEGCIYVDAKGDTSIYTKIFAHCQKAKRLQDLYVLNFMMGSDREKNANNKPIKKKSNSFDPINPIIGQEEIFIEIFGNEIGKVVNRIGIVAKSRKWLLNFDSLEAIYMLPNLINWANNNYWEEATVYIKEYLDSIGYIEDAQAEEFDNLIEQHAIKCQKMKTVMHTFEVFYDQDVFSITPEIDLEDIFRERKVLMVLLPTLEKSVFETYVLAHIVTSQLAYISQKEVVNSFNNLYDNHWQNIIIDDVTYCIDDNLSDYFMKGVNSKQNNWIFGTQDFSYQDKKIFNKILPSCNTYLIMKVYDTPFNFPIYLKALILDNIENIPPIFAKNSQIKDSHYISFREQSEGQAYILTNKNYSQQKNSSYKAEKWALERIKCVYISPLRPDYLYMNRPDSKIIIEKLPA